MYEQESLKANAMEQCFGGNAGMKNIEKAIPEFQDILEQLFTVVNEQEKEINEIQTKVLKISDKRRDEPAIPAPDEPMADNVAQSLRQQLGRLRTNRYYLQEINAQLYQIVG